MNILEPNQTVRFITPAYDKSELVRTGVISDGSCLLHSILHATSLKYRNGDLDKRRSIIQQFRRTLSDSITKDQWLKLSNGELARISFSVDYRKLMDEFYNSPKDNVESFIQTIISKEILEKVFEKCYSEQKDIYMANTKIVSLLSKYMTEKLKSANRDKAIALVQRTENTFNNMFQQAIDNALLNYKQVLQDDRIWLGEEHIELISDIFNYNIRFFNSRDRMPYKFGKVQNFKYDKNLIILWVEESHFEILGRVVDQKITRLFNNDDDFIETINSL